MPSDPELPPQTQQSPEAVPPEAVPPEAVPPEAVTPEAVPPEAVTPEAVTPEAVTPEAVTPEAVPPGPGLKPDLALEQHRAALLVLANSIWNDALQSRCDPSDVVNLTLLKGHRDRRQCEGTSPGQVFCWLKVILANTLYDKLRENFADKRDVRREQSLNAALEESSARLGDWLAHDDPSPSEAAIAEEERRRLMAALAQLPQDEMQAVTLNKLCGLTIDETAERMSCTSDAVVRLLTRGLRRLREIMHKPE